MAKQDRAIRTRQTILTAAAKVFEERGYQAATIAEILQTAGVTKGALYFHFTSKEHLAQGVLHEQDQQFLIPARACKLQELADEVLLHAYRLQTDPMVRAGVRLTMDQHAEDLDRTGPFLRWSHICQQRLEKAQTQGELLPHVIPSVTADIIVATFAGVQSMSQTVSDYQDLQTRTTQLLRHILPSITQPPVLASLDLTEQRGHHVHEEIHHHTQPTTTH
ncbi:TetR/AcrR family transcriptional regulator [Streptomyces sp. NBC_01723]|uniref:ScbR family autoregulator-binding transcription factor n=1 Tax=unclassified Streptomyces TaxID=2593676 RepID=UPI0027853AAA|nr:MULTISPECIES: ScbR family autoregulator-binding transcription factor [unclassified Streptomyces]MDQ0401525.1 AcrR family transcriptional regulator [Streptomyces sp. DSM 40167]